MRGQAAARRNLGGEIGGRGKGDGIKSDVTGRLLAWNLEGGGESEKVRAESCVSDFRAI